MVDHEQDDEEIVEEDEVAAVVDGHLLAFTTEVGADGVSRVMPAAYVAAKIAVPAGYVWDPTQGALLAKPMEPDTTPDPEPLWRQEPPAVPVADQPIHHEGAIEVWFGSPTQPWTPHQLVEVADLPKFRNPAAWRQRLGPVAFSMHRRAVWHDHAQPFPRGAIPAPPVLLGRWGPHDPVPSTLDTVAPPPVVMLSVFGGLVRLAHNGAEVQGAPVYTMTPDQLHGLRARLRGSTESFVATMRAPGGGAS